jgi:hypothetical protein
MSIVRGIVSRPVYTALALASAPAFAKDVTRRRIDMYLRDSVDEAQLRVRLDGMRIEHRDLDDAIAALMLLPVRDQLQIARLKKRKLRLRDEITACEDILIPDIIA